MFSRPNLNIYRWAFLLAFSLPSTASSGPGKAVGGIGGAPSLKGSMPNHSGGISGYFVSALRYSNGGNHAPIITFGPPRTAPEYDVGC